MTNPAATITTSSNARAENRDDSTLIAGLKRVVGSNYVLTSHASTLRFRKGFRFGMGPALAVVQPGTLVEQWRVLRLCAAARKIVIVQAANTGLTGGSTPDGDDYDRGIVERFEHHLMLRMAEDGIEEARAYLVTIFPSVHGAFFECTPEEGRKAFLHRFAAAGAGVRYRAIHRREVQDIVALDIALPRNTTSWFERLPQGMESQLLLKLYYGHFFCQVFHQDYIVKKGRDVTEVEHAMWKILDTRGAEYPAEHNVGHLYGNHYRSVDRSNSFNPGIGHTSKHAHWE